MTTEEQKYLTAIEMDAKYGKYIDILVENKELAHTSVQNMNGYMLIKNIEGNGDDIEVHTTLISPEAVKDIINLFSDKEQ